MSDPELYPEEPASENDPAMEALKPSPVPSTAPRPETEPEEEEEHSPDAREIAMTFLEHLEELRWTLLYCIIALGAGMLLVSLFFVQLADVLMYPLRVALPDSDEAMQGLTTRKPFEVFGVLFQIFIMGGIGLALPFILYFITRFVAPGLTDSEKRILKPGIGAALALFVAGASLAFFVLLPFALRMVNTLHEWMNLKMLWAPGDYYGTVVALTIGVGAAFEFPLIVVLIVYLGAIRTEQLRTGRPYAVVAFLVISAVVTPTGDPITLLVLAVPLYALYEASILVGARIEAWKRKRDALDEAEDALEV